MFERFRTSKATPEKADGGREPMSQAELERAQGLPSTAPLSNEQISATLDRPLPPVSDEAAEAESDWGRARGLPSSAMLSDEQVADASGVQKP